MVKKPEKITEIAAKQRHLLLLEKVRGGSALSKAELSELEQFEAESQEPKKTTTQKRQTKKSYLSMADAQRLGYEFDNLAQADLAAGLSSNLSKYFKRHPKVRAAYDRGRLLKYLVELAPKALIYEAANKLRDLGFEQFDSAQELRNYLDSDSEANELWETARVNGFITNRENLLNASADGNVKAIQLIDKWAVDRQKETSEPSADFFHVSVKQMAELFGTSRQTIHEWYTTKGLPQNADGTFDLYRAINWFGDFQLKKAVRGKDAISPLNPFQAVKTERERLRLEKDRGELIERGSAIGFMAAMMQNIVNAFNALPDLANRIFAQSREEIVARLEDFRDEVMAKIQHVPAELKLSPEAKEKLAELYELLKPQMNADERR